MCLCFFVDPIGTTTNYASNEDVIHLSDSDSDVEMLQEIVAEDDSDSD